jgi:hypothetical protein
VKRANLVGKIDALARELGTTAVWVEGANHTKVAIGARRSVVPRHREIDEVLAKKILRQLGGG